MMKIRNVFLILCFCSVSAMAKDLTHRLGVGFKNNTSENLPSLAFVYYPTVDMAFTGGVGVDSKKDYSAFQMNGGVRYVIYPESNLNFYTAAQFAVVNFEDPVNGKQSGAEGTAAFGAEFFFLGLENLAFTFEAGASLSTVNSSRLRTIGDDPFRAGVIFYF